MRVVIFGTGLYYRRNAQDIYENCEVVALLDNNPEKVNTFLNGVKIYNPRDIITLDYDKIILLCAWGSEMHKQLLELGVAEDKISYWDNFRSQIKKDNVEFCNVENKGNKILIVTAMLDYSGGAMAVLYAAMAIKNKGNTVILSAPEGNPKFLQELRELGVIVVINPQLPYISAEFIKWVDNFDAILVNVFPMIVCACELSKYKPVLWWIHEASEKYSCVYPDTLYKYSRYIHEQDFTNVDIYAVSDIAKKIFNKYFPDRIKNILPYGIPDRFSEITMTGEKIIIAIIGVVSKLKAQKVLLEAILQLKKEEQEKVECWIIGNIREDSYGKEIRKLADKIQKVKILGEKNRKEIEQLYLQIDVLCCPSLEDMLPTVVTEGMMYGKVCIVSNRTGMAKFIHDKKNGLVCRSGDSKNLCEQIRWVLRHPEEVEQIKVKARETYLENFSMAKFGDRLMDAVENTIKVRESKSTAYSPKKLMRKEERGNE